MGFQRKLESPALAGVACYFRLKAGLQHVKLLDLTLPSAAENLALDEALLEEAEASAAAPETLRLWEPVQPAVVVGRSSQAQAEVRLDVCRKLGIPVLRRAAVERPS